MVHILYLTLKCNFDLASVVKKLVRGELVCLLFYFLFKNEHGICHTCEYTSAHERTHASFLTISVQMLVAGKGSPCSLTTPAICDAIPQPYKC